MIHAGKPRAVGYGKIPSFGLLIDPPFVCLVFQNEEKGKECFGHFKKWAEKSEDGDAVSLSFIEKKDGGYTVCVYPEQSLLINRCIPKYLQTEVDPFIITLISFPLSVEKTSPHYLGFKEETKQRPFVFCCNSKTSLFLDNAIQKRKVNYFNEEDIPENSPERAFFVIEDSKDNQHKFEKMPQKETPGQIKNRREKRQKTFLPITLERLNYCASFQTSKGLLKLEGFSPWQILQASCNIVISFRMCNGPYFKGLKKDPTQIDILDYLLTHFEEPKSLFPSDEFFSAEALKNQIIADMRELLKYLGIDSLDMSTEIMLKLLREKGFIDDNG